MALSRRRLLQDSIVTALMLPLLQYEAQADTSPLRRWSAPDASLVPLAHAGDTLVIDTRVTQFRGEGIYFYPDWGQPRPYRVAINVGRGGRQTLTFQDPVSGQERWRQALGNTADAQPRFAGLLETVSPGPLVASRLAPLAVPTLPAMA